jgi:hypothetical protein
MHGTSNQKIDIDRIIPASTFAPVFELKLSDRTLPLDPSRSGFNSKHRASERMVSPKTEKQSSAQLFNYKTAQIFEGIKLSAPSELS